MLRPGSKNLKMSSKNLRCVLRKGVFKISKNTRLSRRKFFKNSPRHQKELQNSLKNSRCVLRKVTLEGTETEGRDFKNPRYGQRKGTTKIKKKNPEARGRGS